MWAQQAKLKVLVYASSVGSLKTHIKLKMHLKLQGQFSFVKLFEKK